MNANDAEKLAQQCWDKVADTPYAACTVDHQLRLCSVVNSIEEQLALSKPPATNIAGLEDFEAEVVRRLTAIALLPDGDEPTQPKKATKPVAKKK